MIIILDNIRSLYNVGSIFRTADAAGVEKIYLCGITPEPVDRFGKLRPQLAKVSLGAEKTVAWEYCKSASRLINKLKKESYKIPKPRNAGPGWQWQGRLTIFAVEQDKKSIPYYKMKPFDKAQGKNKNELVLIFGNEVKGLSKSILKEADKILEIPMRGKKESLNVSVAFGIVVFHLIIKR